VSDTCLESKIVTQTAVIKMLLAVAVLTGATVQAQSRSKAQPDEHPRDDWVLHLQRTE